MSEIHKTGDGAETANGDIPVVAPRNMGKGFTWNTDKGQYEVAVGKGLSITELGSLQPTLSAAPGNLLQVKEDGFYYGIEPPKELKNLYVDAVNGVDNHPDDVPNSGTKEKPLRTLKYALSIAKAGTNRNVFLHTEQTHEISATQKAILKSGVCSLYPYGEAYDTALEQANHVTKGAWKQIIDDGSAPVILFQGVSIEPYTSLKSYSVINFTCLELAFGGQLQMSGMILRNNIGVRIRPATGTTSNKIDGASFARVKQRVGTSIRCDRCKLECDGHMLFNGTSGSYTQDNTSTEVSGISVSHCGFFHPQGGALFFASVILQDNLPCYIVSAPGWDYPLTNELSYSVVGGANDLFPKRVYSPEIDVQNGVKQILAPVTNISPSKW